MTVNEVLARHKDAINREIDRYIEMYRHWHPEGRSDSTSRFFINRHKTVYQKAISAITDEYINKIVTVEIEDRKDLLERIMIQDKQAMSELVQRISSA